MKLADALTVKSSLPGASARKAHHAFSDIESFRNSVGLGKTGKFPVTLLGASNANGHAGAELKLAYDTARAFAGEGYTVLVGHYGGISKKALAGAGKSGLLVERRGKGASAQGDFAKVEVETQLMHKHVLGGYSCAIVVHPGGFETLDKFTEFICLMQIGAMGKTPVIFLDSGDGYWNGFFDWVRGMPVARGLISERDMGVVHTASSPAAAIEIVKSKGATPVFPHVGDLWKLANGYGRDVDKGTRVLEGFGAPIATIFGSARTTPDDPVYAWVRETSSMLSGMGVKVVTGGGSGIMEAAALGAGKDGFGFIPQFLTAREKPSGNYMEVETMNSRKEILVHEKTSAFLAFPGGFGTQDEIFEIVARARHGDIPRVPIFLMGRDFWQGLVDWLQKPLEKGFITERDLGMFRLTDSSDDVRAYFKKEVLSRGK